MKCQKCREDFPENKIEESHDVPCYLFDGFSRQMKKQKADKFDRHYVCKECHLKYENGLKTSFKLVASLFSKKFFGGSHAKK